MKYQIIKMGSNQSQNFVKLQWKSLSLADEDFSTGYSLFFDYHVTSIYEKTVMSLSSPLPTTRNNVITSYGSPFWGFYPAWTLSLVLLHISALFTTCFSFLFFWIYIQFLFLFQLQYNYALNYCNVKKKSVVRKWTWAIYIDRLNRNSCYILLYSSTWKKIIISGGYATNIEYSVYPLTQSSGVVDIICPNKVPPVSSLYNIIFNFSIIYV